MYFTGAWSVYICRCTILKTSACHIGTSFVSPVSLPASETADYMIWLFSHVCIDLCCFHTLTKECRMHLSDCDHTASRLSLSLHRSVLMNYKPVSQVQNKPRE